MHPICNKICNNKKQYTDSQKSIQTVNAYDLLRNEENIDLDLLRNSNHHHPICHNLESANFCIELSALD